MAEKPLDQTMVLPSKAIFPCRSCPSHLPVRVLQTFVRAHQSRSLYGWLGIRNTGRFPIESGYTRFQRARARVATNVKLLKERSDFNNKIATTKGAQRAHGDFYSTDRSTVLKESALRDKRAVISASNPSSVLQGLLPAIEAQLRKIARTMAGWPIIGRLVRIVVALVRLPEFKAIFLDYHYRQHAFETHQLPALLQTISEANQRQQVFETQHLPALLQSISDLNHRQLSSDHDRDNMVKSVPIALRKITRELTAVRDRLEGVTVSMERTVDETRKQVESVANSNERRIDELRIQMERIANSNERRIDELRSQMERIANSNERRIDELRSQMERIANSNERRIGETRGQLENVVSSTEDGIHELQRQLEIQASSIQQVFRESRDQLEGLTSSTQQRIDETRTRLESMTGSVEYLLGRVEFVRRELMFEMRYGAAPSGNGNGHQLKSKSEILSPKKLTAARKQGLRLNLGCGHIPLAGYLNVDRRALPGVDIVAEVDDLPFGPAEVDEILSSHLLEHFPQEQLNRQLLPYLIGLLRPGGEFRAVVPDAQAMIQNYANGSYPFGSLREVTFGAQDYKGDFHYNMFTPQSLAEVLQASGLRNVKLIEAARRNGVCYEFEIVGNK